MKTIKFILGVLAISVSVSSANAQKKVQTFTVEHTINAPAEKVWEVVGENFGDIAYSHHKILTSSYINGSTQAGEGASRVCNFNDAGTKYVKETQLDFDPENYSFKIEIFDARKLPINPEYSYAIQKIVPIDANTSKMVFTMNYRTSPAFLGGMAKGSFKKGIRDYGIAIEHYALTGEKVTKENFKSIKKEYCKNEKKKGV